MESIEYEFIFNGIKLYLKDTKESKMLNYFLADLNANEYFINNLNFEPDDVIIDIGANVGALSIYLAKKFPFTKIYSFEPQSDNYKNFLDNIEKNKITNIKPSQLAVYSDEVEILKISFFKNNSGMSGTFCLLPGEFEMVKTISLDKIILNNEINKIKFLKIDSEGCEFEILESSKLFNSIEIENMGIEIHKKLRILHNKDYIGLENLVRSVVKNQVYIKII